MQKNLSIINFLLIVILVLTLGGTGYLWLNPQYPSRLDGTTIRAAPRPLETPRVARRPIPADVVERVAQGNVFRKERSEYRSPTAAAQPVAEVAGGVIDLPPPKLALKGVVLLNGTKVAIINGNYPVVDPSNQVKEKPLKHKGYRIGDRIGDYQINDIDKYTVTLADNRGRRMTLKVSNRSASQKIQRMGNVLYHKDPNAERTRKLVKRKLTPGQVRAPTPRTPTRIPSAMRPTQVPPIPVQPAPDLKQNPPIKAPPPTVSISGVKVPTQSITPHVSGR